MKKLTLFLLFLPLLTFAQVQPSAGYSYIQEHTPRVASYLTLGFSYTNPQHSNITIQYVDGVGRTLQTVAHKASPSGNDLVGGVNSLDALGRPTRAYLPVKSATNNGSFQPNTAQIASAFYNDSAPYTEVAAYDASPFGYPLKVVGAGQAFRTNPTTPIGTSSSFATAGAGIRKYEITEDANGNVLSVNGNATFSDGDLMRQTTTDEADFTTKVFTDKEGNTIEEWQIDPATGAILKTAYCYDDIGRLRYIIPPKAYFAASTFNETTLPDASYFAEGIYAFRYDARGRIVEKHVPGGGWSFVVYNELDQAVLSQTPYQRQTNLWEWSKYDGHGRVIMTGTWTAPSGSTRTDIQQYFADYQETKQFEERIFNSPTTFFYSNRSFPTEITIVETDIKAVYYFDRTDWNTDPQLQFSYYKTANYNAPMGLPTGSKVRRLDTGEWLTSVMYYDNQNRVIQIQTQNRFGAINQTDNVRNFAGDVLENHTIYRKPNKADIDIKTTYTYDNVGRLTGAVHFLNGKETPLAQYKYDEIGRLKQKNLMQAANDVIVENSAQPNGNQDIANRYVLLNPGTITAENGSYLACVLPSALQQIDYSYNIRGNLRGINLDTLGNIALTNGDVFGLKLDYHETNQFFDGKLHKNAWISPLSTGEGQGAAAAAVRSFSYTYTGFKNLQSATYTGIGNENYNLWGINYDANGNITTLQRNGLTSAAGQPPTWGQTDNLVYTYPSNTSNRLQSINDYANTTKGYKTPFGGMGAFTYYPDGSLKSDANRDISLIEYNYLGLPDKVTFGSGAYIQNSYDAEGLKLTEKFVNGTAQLQRDYMGELIYVNDTLKSILHNEGRIAFQNDSSYIYQFFITDQLGSTRAIIQRLNATTALVQETHYGAWGEVLEGIGQSGESNGSRWNFLFQGKEWIEGLGYDFHSRSYDPYSGRFDQLDGANQFASGYVGMGNIPNMGIDSDGQWVQFAIGAAIGGFSGYQIGKAQGARGWDMVGYIFAGAAIGTLTAGVGSAVLGSFSAAATSGMSLGQSVLTYGASGAASGAFGSGAFAMMAGQNVGQAALRGATWGFAGGAIAGGLEHLSFLNQLDNSPRLAQNGDPLYYGGQFDEVRVKSVRNSYLDRFGKKEAIGGFWGNLGYLWNGRVETFADKNDPNYYYRIEYDRAGYPVGLAPVIGFSPSISPAGKINSVKNLLSKTDYKSVMSNYKNMVEHVQKLRNYSRNPFAYDNLGHLAKNASNPAIVKKIIDSRVAHLQHEINTFYNNITKIISKY